MADHEDEIVVGPQELLDWAEQLKKIGDKLEKDGGKNDDAAKMMYVAAFLMENKAEELAIPDPSSTKKNPFKH